MKYITLTWIAPSVPCNSFSFEFQELYNQEWVNSPTKEAGVALETYEER